MLLATKDETIESAGLGEGGAFTIAASAKAFEVLSSNHYQNKILAVIREITCNAADAHRLTDRPLSDIEVHLPSVAEPYFSVRDYGPGLSHKDCINLYTTYFRSTKDHDNSAIGGFGLGSKSPFAVTDQFTIVSHHGGAKRTYVCFKANGQPSIYLAGQEILEDRDDTGLMVKVASKDWYAWDREAKNFFQWWPELPKITGSWAFKVDPVWDGIGDHGMVSPTKVDGQPEWAFLPFGNGNQVFMGLVTYPLNLDAIPNLPDELRSFFSNTSIFLRFAVGDLSISPSREALSYDPATCNAIIDKLKAVIRDATAAFRNGLAIQPDLYHARRHVYGSENKGVLTLMEKLATANKLLWKGKPVPRNVSTNIDNFGEGVQADLIGKKSYHKKAQRHIQNAVMYDHSATSKDKLFWAKTAPRNYIATLTDYFGGAPAWRGLILRGGNYDDVCKFCETMGLPQPIDYASLPVPAKVPAARGTVLRTTGYTFKDNVTSYTRSTTPLDLEGGGLYLDFTDGKPAYSQQRALTVLFGSGFFAGNEPRVIGLPNPAKRPANLKLALALNEWAAFDAAWFQENVSEEWLERAVCASNIRDWLLRNFYGCAEVLRTAHARNSWRGADDFFNLAGPYFNGSGAFFQPGHLNYDAFTAHASEEQFAAIQRGIDAAKRAEVEWHKFLDANPMMRYTPLNNVPTDILNAYINR